VAAWGGTRLADRIAIMDGRDLGFIGGGRITTTLLERLAAEAWAVAGACVSEPDVFARTELQARAHDVEVTDDNAAPARRRIVIVAVPRAALDTALLAIAPSVSPEAIVVSLVPGAAFAKLEALLGGFTRLVRVMPSAASLVGAGYNPVAFAPSVPLDVRDEIDDFLSVFGAHPLVDESKMEAYAILTSMGPTFFWNQWQALRDLARSFGLGAAETDAALSAMVDGARRTFFDSGKGFPSVNNLVATRPLEQVGPEIVGHYRRELPLLFRKLKGDS
jgi:pyrroline-5-carboxylate reductase